MARGMATCLLVLLALIASLCQAARTEFSGKDAHKTGFVTVCRCQCAIRLAAQGARLTLLTLPNLQEPDYYPTYFAVETLTEAPSLLAPGYIFIDPVHGAHKIGSGGRNSGPQIREQDGTLIWYGGSVDNYGEQLDRDKANRRARVQDLHTCDYMNTSGAHLCWSERASVGRRKKIVVDEHYELVDTLVTGLDFAMGQGYGKATEWGNMHEFNMVDNGTRYLQPAWPARHADLEAIGGPKKGVIWDGCFQDVSLSSGESSFDWCMIAHYNIWDTISFPATGPILPET